MIRPETISTLGLAFKFRVAIGLLCRGLRTLLYLFESRSFTHVMRYRYPNAASRWLYISGLSYKLRCVADDLICTGPGQKRAVFRGKDVPKLSLFVTEHGTVPSATGTQVCRG